MRILFVTVELLGLLVVGISAFEIYIASEYGSRVSYVQSVLAQESSNEMADAHQKGDVSADTSRGDNLSQSLDGVEPFLNGWLVVMGVGTALFFVGVCGFIKIRKRYHVKSVTV
jgi:hypothetical protein